MNPPLRGPIIMDSPLLICYNYRHIDKCFLLKNDREVYKAAQAPGSVALPELQYREHTAEGFQNDGKEAGGGRDDTQRS